MCFRPSITRRVRCSRMHQQGHLYCSQDNWEWSCRISAAYCILRRRDQQVRPGSGLETGKSPFLVLAANKVTWSVGMSWLHTEAAGCHSYSWPVVELLRKIHTRHPRPVRTDDRPPQSTESHKHLNHILCDVCRATPAPNGFRSPPVRARRRRIPKSTTPYEYHTVSGLR